MDSVTSLDWSPAGKEFVSGSVDGHVRIWKSDHQAADARKVGYSRELYKGRRMYNLEQVRWTNDNKYVLSGSADGALRLWKAKRAQPLHRINARQRASIHYAEKLAEKYQHMPEIGLIQKFRNAKVPHRIPRNGVFYKKERKEQKRLQGLTKKLNPTSRDKKVLRRKFAKDRGDANNKRWVKNQRKPWAHKVVQKRGIMGDHAE